MAATNSNDLYGSQKGPCRLETCSRSEVRTLSHRPNSVRVCPWSLAVIPYRSPTVDPTKILTRQELRLVLSDLKRQAQRSKQGHVNLILFRLAVCCGLRVSEIAHLHIGDVRTD